VVFAGRRSHLLPSPREDGLVRIEATNDVVGYELVRQRLKATTLTEL
jgi:hypothetical protein